MFKNWKQDEIWSSPQGSTEQAHAKLLFWKTSNLIFHFGTENCQIKSSKELQLKNVWCQRYDKRQTSSNGEAKFDLPVMQPKKV